MPTSLNLLLLEDSPTDAELMIDVLREAGFGRQVVRDVTVRHVWTVETIRGFLHATSFASLAALQQHAHGFDADVRKALLAVDQNGVYKQDVRFGARIARR